MRIMNRRFKINLFLIFACGLWIQLQGSESHKSYGKHSIKAELFQGDKFDFEKQNKSSKKPKDEKKIINSIYNKFKKDSLRIAKKYSIRMEKLEKYKTKQLANIEEGKTPRLIQEINKDNLRLKSIVRDLVNVRKLLKSIILKLNQNLTSLSTDKIIEREEVQNTIEIYNNDFSEMNLLGVTVINGIKGDSTLSSAVMYARIRALELIMKYENLYLEYKFTSSLNKLDKSFNKSAQKIKNKNQRKGMDGTDDLVLRNIVADLMKLKVILADYIQKLRQDFDNLSPDLSIQREEILKSINTYNSDHETILKDQLVIVNGIEGDSTLSEEVILARFSALNLLQKYESHIVENEYLEKTINLDNKYAEMFKLIEEKSNFRLKKVHDDELLKIAEMRERLTTENLPLEKKSKTLQDSLDIIAIKSLAEDEKLDSLVNYRNILDNKEEELSRKLYDYQGGFSHKIYNDVLILLHESERAFYKDSLTIAKERCLQAIELAPNYPESYVRLGSIYYSNGEVDSARVVWKKALQLESSHEELKKFMFLHGLN